MLNWFSKVMQLFQLAPMILQMIQQVEQIVGPGNGAAKKAIVMAPLTSSVPPELIPDVSSMIDNMVAAQNKAVAVEPAKTNNKK